MALNIKDLMKSIGGVFSRVSADTTRRPDGGTSHYRPLRKKTAEPLPGEMTQMQDPQYVHTGFTGMNPPAFFGGYDQQPVYDQTAYGQTAYVQPAYDQTAYGQTAYGQTAYGQTSWQPAYDRQGGQTSYFPQDQAPQDNYVGKGSFSAARRNNNISYMPGVDPRMERGQVHVEHIITLTGLKSCYEAIECM